LRAGDRLLTRDPACAGAARAQSENAREAGGVGSAVSSVHRGRYIVAHGWWLSQNLSRKPPVAQGTGHRGPPWWSARRACSGGGLKGRWRSKQKRVRESPVCAHV